MNWYVWRAWNSVWHTRCPRWAGCRRHHHHHLHYSAGKGGPLAIQAQGGVLAAWLLLPFSFVSVPPFPPRFGNTQYRRLLSSPSVLWLSLLASFWRFMFPSLLYSVITLQPQAVHLPKFCHCLSSTIASFCHFLCPCGFNFIIPCYYFSGVSRGKGIHLVYQIYVSISKQNFETKH